MPDKYYVALLGDNSDTQRMNVVTSERYAFLNIYHSSFSVVHYLVFNFGFRSQGQSLH